MVENRLLKRNIKTSKGIERTIDLINKALKKEDFLQIAIGLRKNEPIYDLLLINWKKFKNYKLEMNVKNVYSKFIKSIKIA